MERLALEVHSLMMRLANGSIIATMGDRVQLDFKSGAAMPAGAEIARGSLWILHSCLERLERRDGLQVSFFSHSYSRIGLLPVINLSMIDAPCLTGRRCWRFWATTSVENSGNLRKVDS